MLQVVQGSVKYQGQHCGQDCEDADAEANITDHLRLPSILLLCQLLPEGHLMRWQPFLRAKSPLESLALVSVLPPHIQTI